MWHYMLIIFLGFQLDSSAVRIISWKIAKMPLQQFWDNRNKFYAVYVISERICVNWYTELKTFHNTLGSFQNIKTNIKIN